MAAGVGIRAGFEASQIGPPACVFRLEFACLQSNTPVNPKPTDVIDRYEILRPLGRGGMGTLYLARDPAIDRLVAIKLLREEFHNSDLRERFTREAQSAGRLRHINIVTVFDVGEHGSQPFIAMEYVRGETLASLIKRQVPLSLAHTLRLMEELCAALHYAHKAGVIHRDVKPANLMLDEEGVLKILDFGIARLGTSDMTQAGMVMGTLNYMAPEQMEGKPVDARADMFAAGAVFYEMLCYRRAFPGDHGDGILHKILYGAPESLCTLLPDLDPTLIAIVDRCLEKRPEDRYRDLSMVARQIALVRSRLRDEDARPASMTSTTVLIEQVETPKPAAGLPKTPRPGTNREALFRRRAEEIERRLGEARDALARGEFEAAWKACQQAQLLDPEHQAADDLAQRARAGLDEQQLQTWLQEARDELKRGAITAASLLVERALSLSVSSPEVSLLREAIERARREQAAAQERARLVDRALVRARDELSAGVFDGAAAAVSEALVADPANTQAKALQEQIAEAQRQAAKRARAAAIIEDAKRLFARGDHRAALIMLRDFEPEHPSVSQTLQELTWEAEEIARNRAAVNAEFDEQPLRPAVARQPYSLRKFVTYSAAAVLVVAVALGVLFLKRGDGPNRPSQDQPSPAAGAAVPSAPSNAPAPAEASPQVLVSSPPPETPTRGAGGRVTTGRVDQQPTRAPAAAPIASSPSQAPPASIVRQAGEQQAPRVDSLIADGLERFGRGVYDEALALFRQALAIDPGNRRAQDGIDRVTAAKTAEQRVLQNPSSANPPANTPNQRTADTSAQVAVDLAKAEDAFRLGQYDRAIAAFESVLRLDSNNAAARAGIQKVQRAKTAEEQILKKKQLR